MRSLGLFAVVVIATVMWSLILVGAFDVVGRILDAI